MRIKTLLMTLLAVAAASLFAATVPFASGATAKGKKSDSVRVSTVSVPGLGKVLANSAGRTLYMFVPDKQKKVTCFKVCAKIWPPLPLPKGAKAVAAGSVKQSLLGSDKDSSVAGGRVVTYNHWPLYTYLGDPKAGVANGQGLNMNGGLWYVLSAAGKVIKHKAAPTGGGSSTTTSTTTTTSNGTTTTSTATTTSTSTTQSMGGACPPGTADADNDGDQDAGGPDDGDGCL